MFFKARTKTKRGRINETEGGGGIGKQPRGDDGGEGIQNPTPYLSLMDMYNLHSELELSWMWGLF